MDQQLMLGILLIVVGIAFALIAVAVVLNRRADRETGPAEGGEFEEDPQSSTELALAQESQEPGQEQDEPPGGLEPAREPDLVENSQADDPEPDAEGTDLELLAEIYRDQATGELVLKRRGQEFRTASQIGRDSELGQTAAELTQWLASAPPKSKEKIPEGARDSMVHAIDAILQHTLKTSELEARGVRLVPGGTGGVKVLIGVKTYEMDDVPDDEIRRLIRQAVAEWEASQ